MNKLVMQGVVGRHFTAMDIKEELKKFDKSRGLEIDLTSPGGSVEDGFLIYEELLKWQPKINLIGSNASMSTVISQAAAPGELRISEISGEFLVHSSRYYIDSLFWWYPILTSQDLKDLAKGLDVFDEKGFLAYTSRNVTAEIAKEAMSNESPYTPAEAIEYGFVDGLIEDSTFEKAAIADSNAFMMKQRINMLASPNYEGISKRILNFNNKSEDTDMNELEKARKEVADMKAKAEAAERKAEAAETAKAEAVAKAETLEKQQADKDAAELKGLQEGLIGLLDSKNIKLTDEEKSILMDNSNKELINLFTDKFNNISLASLTPDHGEDKDEHDDDITLIKVGSAEGIKMLQEYADVNYNGNYHRALGDFKDGKILQDKLGE